MNNKSIEECINYCLDKSIDKADREMYLNIVRYLISFKNNNYSYGYGPVINTFPINECDGKTNAIVNYSELDKTLGGK